MKLKEKLAEKALFNKNWDHLSGLEQSIFKFAFIVGFDKAKQLLRQMEPCADRKWFEIPMSHLDNLGEEEVDSQFPPNARYF